MKALHDAEPRMIAWAAWGAADEAVEVLVARIGSELAQGRALPSLTAHRVRMLAHVGSGCALEHAAVLGRMDLRVRRVLEEELVAVPSEGPARVRYALDARDVYAMPEARVEAGMPSATEGLSSGGSFGRGKNCAAPLVEVLRADARVDERSVPEGWVFVASRCEDCDEAIEARYDFDATMRLEGLAVEPACEGVDEPSDVPIRLWLGTYGANRALAWARHAGRLGGRPMWWQSAEPAKCGGCGALMFYVGCVFVASVRDDVADLAIYGFRCDECGRRAQVTQMT